MSNKRNTRTSQTAATSNSPVLRDHSLLISTLNPYITCSICEGYLIDATTVIDCLHTFCKSCLLKHFEDSTDCPKCHFMIHQSHPSHYVAFDRTVQDIVYKLVPGLQVEEMKRREDFQKKSMKLRRHALETAESSSESNNGDEQPEMFSGTNEKENEQQQCCCANSDPALAHHRRDESVFVQLVSDGKPKSLTRSFVRVSGMATINTIRRLLAYLLLDDIQRYNEYDVYCNNELMGRDYSMSFIQKTRWRNQSTTQPLLLNYREHIDF